ncbi:MAG: Rpn family recombination-promoting nuclease/putative transposase [Lachnospiraceae bacterium]|nr:Rpn family recombination-promoting nuclease/putative transposase [Lachnospiraceae bacterium]
MTKGKENGITIEAVFGKAVPRKDMLHQIRADSEISQAFDELSAEDQDRILAYLCGEKSLQILSDKFFKKILDPLAVPERVESLLSAIYGQEVKIESVLPREGVMVQEGSQVIMDVLVRIAGGETVDIEMQRLGFLFPGERTSCYLADMIMRQYEKTRSSRGKDFSYHDMKPVNLIVIMDQSTEEFHHVKPEYLHRRQTSYSSGVKVATLEHVTYISLDTFRKKTENKIETLLDAWLTFFTVEDTAKVLALVDRWPMFLPMYQDIASFRWNPAEVIGMFSEALRIMDRNTTKYMIDSMHQELDDLRAKAENQSQTIADLTQNNEDLSQINAGLTQANTDLTQTNADLMQRNADQKSQLNKYKELLLRNGIDPDSSSQTESCATPPPVHR